MTNTEFSKLKEKLTALETEVRKQQVSGTETTANRPVLQDDLRKTIEEIQQPLLPQFLSRIAREDKKFDQANYVTVENPNKKDKKKKKKYTYKKLKRNQQQGKHNPANLATKKHQ